MMWHLVKDLWAHNRKLLIAFVAVLALAGFFGVQSVRQFIYWNDPSHQDQNLAGWMTPRYVGQSYNIPPEIVQAAFEMDRDGAPRRMSLEAIAGENGWSIAEMQLRIETAAEAWRAIKDRPGK